MGESIVANKENFAVEVIQKSHEKPVIVDFYATWCGPCQILKPILEKLATEYDFVLAKVDIDTNPELASAFKVEGVPDVKIVSQGKFRNGFVGVLPEPQIRDLLASLNLKSGLEIGLEAVQVAIAAGELSEAQTLFTSLLEQYPDDLPLRLQAAKLALRLDHLDQVDQILAPIQEDKKEFFDTAQAIRALAQFKQELQQPSGGSELDDLYLQACRATVEEQYEMALKLFLDLVGRDRKYRDDGARKAMITLFNLLGYDHPLTKDYRKQLMMVLY